MSDLSTALTARFAFEEGHAIIASTSKPHNMAIEKEIQVFALKGLALPTLRDMLCLITIIHYPLPITYYLLSITHYPLCPDRLTKSLPFPACRSNPLNKITIEKGVNN